MLTDKSRTADIADKAHMAAKSFFCFSGEGGFGEGAKTNPESFRGALQNNPRLPRF